MKNNRWASKRTKNMTVSMFNTMDAAKVEAQRKGLEIIDLSVGSSDLPAPTAAMEALREATRHSETHGYCLHSGTQALRQAAAGWFEERYGGNFELAMEFLDASSAEQQKQQDRVQKEQRRKLWRARLLCMCSVTSNTSGCLHLSLETYRQS